MNKNEVIEYAEELSREENKEQCTWFRHLALVSSTILGVIFSLHNIGIGDQLYCWMRGLAVLLLSIGNMGIFVLLYVYSLWSAQKMKKLYQHEMRCASREHRDIGSIGVKIPRWCHPLELFCYGCIVTSFLLLAISSL